MSDKKNNRVAKSSKRGSSPGEHRGGRIAGVPNKSTAAAREAIARFIDGNAPKLNQWLDEIYNQDGPLAAFRCVGDLLEYHVPKLARTELTGNDGQPLPQPVVRIEFVRPKRDDAGSV